MHTSPDARSRLESAALELQMLDPAAPLDAIATRARVGRATLFRLYRDRRALLRAAARGVLEQLDRELERRVDANHAPRVRLAAMVEVLISGGLPLHAIMAAPGLADDPVIKRAIKRLDRHFAPVIAAAVASGLIREDHSPTWLAAAFDALLFAAWEQIRSGELTIADAPKRVIDTLLDGFGRGRRR